MKILVSLMALALAASPCAAQTVKLGDLTIENPWARATPKGSDVGVGYLTIHNNGAVADRLTAVTTDFAHVQIHEMKMNGAVMQMRELPDGVEIPAHGEIKLAPGGDHLMFVGLKAPLVKGASAHATLTFAHAGAVSVDFPIQGLGASGPAAPMKGM